MALRKKPATKKAAAKRSKSDTFVAIYGLDRDGHTRFIDDRPTQREADAKCAEILADKDVITSTDTITLPLTDLADHRRKYGYGL